MTTQTSTAAKATRRSARNCRSSSSTCSVTSDALRKYYDRGEEGVDESPRDRLIREREFKTKAGDLLKNGT